MIDSQMMTKEDAVALKLESGTPGSAESTESILNMAMYDGLTGLFNRRAIYVHLHAELDRALRQKTPLSLLLLGIDDRENISAQQGRATFDSILQLTAGVVDFFRRPYDWAGRWNDDAILLILPGARAQDAANVFERIQAKMSIGGWLLPNGGILEIGVSAGIASVGAIMDVISDFDADLLIEQAAQALAQAKQMGKHSVYLFDAA
ncbi:MAG: GGDEF domain-containing protein [Chloroflexi bacterium]|nr:GGDEF domain-containing protein [Chloroflexota bacterium]